MTAAPTPPKDHLNELLDQMLSKHIKPEVLLGEVDFLLRTKPTLDEVLKGDEPVLAWRGRAAAVLKAWDLAESTKLISLESRMSSGVQGFAEPAYKSLIQLLHQARHSLQMRTIGPVSAALEKGAVFDYFDEIRKIVERASSDILFVDPYLDAEFVSRYLSHVPTGTAIRLLTSDKKLATLLPAVDAFAKQSAVSIAVRMTNDIHDRYVFVDRKECYQSGASFKDGGAKAGTTISQITDAFAAMASTYEALWAVAIVHRPIPRKH